MKDEKIIPIPPETRKRLDELMDKIHAAYARGLENNRLQAEKEAREMPWLYDEIYYNGIPEDNEDWVPEGEFIIEFDGDVIWDEDEEVIFGKEE